MLNTEGLAVGYDNKTVINNVEISVSPGKIVTLIGPNGSGKSTILKTITRQLKPISGAIYLDKKAMTNLSESDVAQCMAMVTTERIRPELMTCREVVETGRYPYTGRFGVLSDFDEQIVLESMKIFDSDDIADCLFSKISDGQRQRVMLSRALCQQPKILVLDEPTSFLDIKYKLEILSCLVRLVRDKKIAVIMSLHELDLARKISDQIVCVSDGRITKQGLPGDIFQNGYINELFCINQDSILEEFKDDNLI